MYLGIESRRFT